jgi:phosphomannomutase
MDLEKERELQFVFGYEEALGYTVGPLVRDKDGISAALLFAELWAARRAEGKTMFDELESIARKFGAYVSGQVNVTMKGKDGQSEIAAIMERLRSAPPSSVARFSVTAFTDVKRGIRKSAEGESKIALPPSDVLFFDLEGGHRIIARPSGTEPKIKFYFDVRGQMKDGESLADAEARLNVELEALKSAFSKIAAV